MTGSKKSTTLLIKKCCSYFKQDNIYLKFLLITTLFFTLSSFYIDKNKKGDQNQNSNYTNQQSADEDYNSCYFYVKCPYTTDLGKFECYYPPAKPYTIDDLKALGFKLGYPCYKLQIKVYDSYYKFCSKYDQKVTRTIYVWDDKDYDGYFDYYETGVKCYLYYTLVADVTAPYIKCADPLYVSCVKDIPSPDPTTVTATDNCTKYPTVTFVYDKVVYEYGCKKTIWRYYKATDDCGNYSYCYQIIYVEDKTPPYIKCPDPIYVSCYKDIPYPDATKVYASDNCGGYVDVKFWYDKVVYSYGCKKTIWRYYKATDECGNYSYCYQIIYVEDKTPPTIYCPKDIYVGCYDYIPKPDPYSVSAYDNCGGKVYVYFLYDKYSSYYCPKIIYRYYKAVDECGNYSTCYQKIYVGYDDVTTKKATESGTESLKGAQVQQAATALKVEARPNPFKQKVQFLLTSPQDGQGSLELYDLQGRKVATAWSGNVIKGQTITVNYVAPATLQGLLTYRFTVGKQVVHAKIISLK